MRILLVLGVLLAGCATTPAESPTARRFKAALDAVPAIDTHDHLWPFDRLPGYVETDRGRGMTLASLWTNSYLGWYNPIPGWKPKGDFDEWWPRARNRFDN